MRRQAVCAAGQLNRAAVKEGAERRLVAESGGMYGGAHNNTQLEEGSAAKLSGPGSPAACSFVFNML